MIEPESFIDAFDTDTFDHLRGVLELRIKPERDTIKFPDKWRLGENAVIKYVIEQDTPTTSKSSEIQHKLSSSSTERTLSKFLELVHKGTNKKGSVVDWEGGLKKQGITEYEDLERLTEQDWARLKSPSILVCKLIQMHIERQRHTGKTQASGNGNGFES